MKKKNFVKLVFSILICQFAGLLGSIFNLFDGMSWYNTLNKPAFTPPDWVFPVVWPILYLLMGISLFLILKLDFNKFDVKTGILAFAVQLILNVFWPAVFFGLESILGGQIVLILLWGTIVFTIIKFYSLSKAAAFLLIPYILWVTYAGILNLSIFWLNR